MMRTPLDGPVLVFLIGVLVVSVVWCLWLEVRDARRRRAAQRLYARGLGLVSMPRPTRRSRSRARRWSRW